MTDRRSDGKDKTRSEEPPLAPPTFQAKDLPPRTAPRNAITTTTATNLSSSITPTSTTTTTNTSSPHHQRISSRLASKLSAAASNAASKFEQSLRPKLPTQTTAKIATPSLSSSSSKMFCSPVLSCVDDVQSIVLSDVEGFLDRSTHNEVTDADLREWVENVAFSQRPGVSGRERDVDWATILTNKVLDRLCHHVNERISSLDLRSGAVGPSSSLSSSSKSDHEPFFLFLQRVSLATMRPNPCANVPELRDAGRTTLRKTFFVDNVLSRSILLFLKAACDDADHGDAEEHRPSEPPRLYHIPPTTKPSPFETSIWSCASLIVVALSFLGDPVSVCRVKSINRFCQRIVQENEHRIMRDAVRVGGLRRHTRPRFWTWVTINRCARRCWRLPPKVNTLRLADLPEGEELPVVNEDKGNCNPARMLMEEFRVLERIGRESKWAYLIERDVLRSFGNLPPHKANSQNNRDSIIRVLVMWGRNKLLRARNANSNSFLKNAATKITTTTSTPKRNEAAVTAKVRRFNSNKASDVCDDEHVENDQPTGTIDDSDNDDDKNDDTKLALNGNDLSSEDKIMMQGKLRNILHALAASFPDIGYCQGMDYVVIHLLRVVGDEEKGRESRCARKRKDITNVEETVFEMMNVLMTRYNLRHMYMPHLRCLKRCCRMFERLIKLKLPVLADHFEHHDMNIGIFALGWFQTLFVYLPSMPSRTVSHIWDIWLVERSFKIFFRVGVAILFLSQPILLNYETEGMILYLNTLPDSNLLSPDILIACAMEIKVTNKLLMELESDCASGD